MTSCPTADQLLLFLEGGSAPDLDEVGEHIDTCPTCRRRLDSIVSVRLPVAPARHDSIPFGPPTPLGPLGRVGSYHVIRELGGGGFGVVFLAHDETLDRPVAIKVLRPERAANPDDRARFEREGRRAAGVRHENVVSVLAVGHAPDFPYPFLVMEFVEGESLRGALRRRGRFDPRDAADAVRQAARGLAAAHALGQIHRDVKPDNLLVERSTGRVRVSDFGLARRADAEATRLTQTGAVMGTPAYMSPEQVRDPDVVDARTDLYALGAVLYELLVGEPPFVGAGVLEVLRQAAEDEPRPPRRLNAAVPPDLETVCLKCLEKEPSKRYPTAEALADDLTLFLTGDPIRARPVGRFERGARWARRNKILVGAGIAVASALLAGTAVSVNFGLEARAEARRASGEEARANGERDAAISARNELARVNTELDGERVRALLAPLGNGSPGDLVSPPEIGTLWELTRYRGTEVADRFLTEAVSTPQVTRQLRNRAALALHAAVGLNPTHRERTEALLAVPLRADGTQADRQTDLALIAAHLDGLSEDTADATGRALGAHLAAVRGAARSPSGVPILHVADSLARVAPRMRPAAARRETVAAVAALLGSTGNATDEAIATARLVRYWDPATALRTFMDVRGRENEHGRRVLDAVLPTVIAAANTEEAVRFLTDELTRDRFVWSVLVPLVPAAAQRVNANTGNALRERAALVLLREMAELKGSQFDTLRECATLLVVLTERLPQERAKELLKKAADVMGGGKNLTSDAPTAPTLRALAPILAAQARNAEGADTCDRAARAMTGMLASANERIEPEGEVRERAQCAAVLIEPLGPHARRSRCSEAVRALEGQLARHWENDGQETKQFLEVTDGLIALSRVDPGATEPLATKVIALLVKRIKVGASSDEMHLAAQLVALAGTVPETIGRPACANAAACLFEKLTQAADRNRLDLTEALITATRGMNVADAVALLHRTVALEDGSRAQEKLMVSLADRLAARGPGAEPQPLVDLLKHPFCVGPARDATLAALAAHFGRPFADQWEFVEYARGHQPQLDRTTPPVRQ